jgi:hypothetical protein
MSAARPFERPECLFLRAHRENSCLAGSDHGIEKGDLFLVVTDPATGSAWSYCHRCAIALLDRVAGDVRKLHGQLNAQPPGQASAGA